MTGLAAPWDRGGGEGEGEDILEKSVNTSKHTSHILHCITLHTLLIMYHDCSQSCFNFVNNFSGFEKKGLIFNVTGLTNNRIRK